MSQSIKKISSYEEIVSKFDNALIENKHSIRRPNYWGGFSFKPEYFEFWTGHENRINKRLVFKKKKIHGIPLLFNLNNIFAKLYEVSIKFSLNMKIIITMLAVFR